MGSAGSADRDVAWITVPLGLVLGEAARVLLPSLDAGGRDNVLAGRFRATQDRSARLSAYPGSSGPRSRVVAG